VTTATLVLLNSLHTTFVLSEEIEKNLVLGRVDIAHTNIKRLELAIPELQEKNGSLTVLNILNERLAVLKDVLCVETEKIWTTKFVRFSEEGDIQLSIQRNFEGIFPFSDAHLRTRIHPYNLNAGATFKDIEFIRFQHKISVFFNFSRVSRSSP
jgi:hypothetical protein